MKNLLTVSVATALAAALPAQGLTTASGYAVSAHAGNGSVQGVAGGTSIGATGLAIRAADGTRGGPSALASTDVGITRLTSTSGSGAAVHVYESGVANSDGSRRAGAGTSNDPRGGGRAPHALAWAIPAPAGTVAAVTVAWRAGASANASTGVAVDVDGDGAADFTGRVSNGSDSRSQTFRVTAGRAGFSIGIITSGNAAVLNGSEQYAGRLSVTWLQPSTTPSCTFTAFGRPCGGTLAAQEGRTTSGGVVIQYRVSGAAANAVAVLGLGTALSSPVTLPGTRCPLLVNPRALINGSTDANGNAGWRLPLPVRASGLNVDAQVVTLTLGATGAQLAATNGVNTMCQ